MSEPLQRRSLQPNGYGGVGMYPDPTGPYVLAAEAEAHEAGAVAAARAEHEHFCDCYAEVMAERYAQGQRDERQRIRTWCRESEHRDGCACDVIDTLRRIDTPTPHPDDHPAAGCVHCQDLAADADDLAREIDREEGR